MLLALILSLIKAVPDTANEYLERQINKVDETYKNECQIDDNIIVCEKIKMLENMLVRQEEEIKLKKLVYQNEKNLYDKLANLEQKNKQDNNLWDQQKRMLSAQLSYNKALDRRDKIQLDILNLKGRLK
ncbi:hypothetical protein EGP95_05790 [bacterium]|nr:hypothetical protein [bacterium]